jgi:TonB family protein
LHTNADTLSEAQMKYRHVAVVFLGVFFSFAFMFVGTAFAEPSDLNNLAKEFSQALEKAQVHTVIVSDFVREEGRVSLQGVLLADRFWFALLQSQRGFRTLNRDLLRARVYNHPPANDASRKDEREAANAAGAEVLITGKIDQEAGTFILTITASNVLSGKQIEQRSASLPRTRPLDELAVESVRPNGPTYLLGQNGISTPSCLYCPYPQYSEQGLKNKIEGAAVIEAIIDASGRAQRVWEVSGLSDGLTEQAMDVVRRWRFKPAQVPNGDTVAVMVPVDVTFRLP